MQICFYSPYFPNHFGGGEKHLLDVAVEAAKTHQVSVGISGVADKQELQKIQVKYEEFYGKSLQSLDFVASPLGSTASFFQKLWWTNTFDAIYYVTDGSLFFSLAKYNYLHVQIPFTQQLSVLDTVKLHCWQSINTNSEFTKHSIEKYWQVKVNKVINPMVDLDSFTKKTKKEKVILHVGRFFKQLHAKRQDILLSIFKKLSDEHQREMKDWKLQFVGSVEDQDYFDELQKSAKNYSVDFFTTASRAEVIAQYQKAAIYWHATGFEVDEEKQPEKVEHFGITTIEAMAAATVPLVIAKGGQREVLGDLYEELHWDTPEECASKTLALITNQKKYQKLQEQVVAQAANFAATEFSKKVTALFTV